MLWQASVTEVAVPVSAGVVVVEPLPRGGLVVAVF